MDHAYRRLAADILRRAVVDYTCGTGDDYNDADWFFTTDWAKELFETLGIEPKKALLQIVSNRRKYLRYIERARAGDRTAQGELNDWWRAHFTKSQAPII